MTRFALIPLVVFLLNTCGNSGAGNSIDLNQEFALKFHETRNLKSEPVTFRFGSLVQESRCPKSVTCITAGEAVIELEIAKEKEKSTVRLSTAPNSSEATFDRYTIKLVDVQPYPGSPGQPDPDQYVVRLILSEAGNTK